jgi:hypothetical protein
MYKIAISGKANTGKNTLSKMIVKELRKDRDAYLGVKYMAFADPIKEMVRQMFPSLPRNYLYGSSKYRGEIIPGAFKDGKPLTIRQLLLDLGTAVGRGYKETVWLDNFDFRLDKVKYKKIIMVTDVRFRNEFEHLKNKGFYQIRLYRDTGQPAIQHVSESNQNTIADSEFDYVIHNDKGLGDLKREVIGQIIPNLKYT